MAAEMEGTDGVDDRQRTRLDRKRLASVRATAIKRVSQPRRKTLRQWYSFTRTTAPPILKDELC